MLASFAALRRAVVYTSLFMSEMRPGDWTCAECGASPVFGSRDDCFRCGAPRPEGDGNFARPRRMQQQQHSFKPGDWECPECGFGPNFASKMACHKCGAPKPGGAGRDRRDRGAPRGRTGAEEPEFRRDFAGTRCFVENLSYETDWALLKDSFLDEGYPVVYCSVSTDQYTGESKGHGIVQFETVHAAKHAIEHMTGFELDGRRINVREDYQDKRRRDSSAESGATAEDAAVRGGGGAARREAWKDRAWTRVAGSADGDAAAAQIDEKAIIALLAKRDGAREARDFRTADAILDELAQLRVYVDDARRQRNWWVGQRADGATSRGGGKRSRGASAAPNRRQWFRDGDDGDDGW